MATGYEVQMYHDIHDAVVELSGIRKALEQIADVMKSFNTVAAYLVDQQGGVTTDTGQEQ